MVNNMTQNTEELENVFEQMTESYMSALDKNLDAQSTFMEQWMDSIDEAMSEEQIEEQTESSIRAYEAWMEAAETSFDRIGDYMEGESADPEEFRDIWLSAANRAFKETMSTTAFAAATGQNVDQMLEMRRQFDETAEDTLHALRFATTGDVQEVGERLVETERRQHVLEQQIEELSDERIVRIDDRLAEVGETLDALDERTTDLDELNRLDRLDDMVERLNTLDQRTAQLDRLDDIFTELEGIADRLERLDDHADRLDDIEATLDDLHAAQSGETDSDSDTDADGSDADEE